MLYIIKHNGEGTEGSSCILFYHAPSKHDGQSKHSAPKRIGYTGTQIQTIPDKKFTVFQDEKQKFCLEQSCPDVSWVCWSPPLRPSRISDIDWLRVERKLDFHISLKCRFEECVLPVDPLYHCLQWLLPHSHPQLLFVSHTKFPFSHHQPESRGLAYFA